jgi:hypothetical protein
MSTMTIIIENPDVRMTFIGRGSDLGQAFLICMAKVGQEMDRRAAKVRASRAAQKAWQTRRERRGQ